jgi:3-oxoacyl-[acyl-carrier-protein] synthase II
MQPNRVVITGMGIISSAGDGLKTFADAISSGERYLVRIDDSRIEHFNAKYAGLIDDSIINEKIASNPEFADDDRYVKLAAIAAHDAVVNASVSEFLASDRAGLMVGTCSGPMITIENQYQAELDGAISFTSEEFFNRQYYSAAFKLAKKFKIKGPVFTVTTACSAFAAAIATATDFIRDNKADIILVGGSDAFSTTTLAGFAGLKATHDSMCSPFSVPPGLNLGEGAGFVVLEKREHAVSRNVNIIGEILGCGLSNDGYHCSAPDPAGKGASSSMNRAILQSKIDITGISYVNAHGTGTSANDKAETKAIRRIFGETTTVSVSSSKGAVGHCLGAAGAVETIGVLSCSERGVVPPTVGYTEPRDGCTLDYVAETGRIWAKNSVFVKNNFAFGGNNASLVITTRNNTDVRLAIMDNDPVCITGMGTISAAGLGTDSIITALKENRSTSSIKDIKNREPFECCAIPADALQLDRRVDSRIERSAKLTVIATLQALQSAGITERQVQRLDMGLYMNIAQGSTWAEPEHIIPLLSNNYQLNQVNAFPFIVPNSVTGTVCRVLGLTGHNITLCNGHGAGFAGLGVAFEALKNGHVPYLLCGSMDDLTERGLIDCIHSNSELMNVASPGEGAAVFLLEKFSHAKQRGIEPDLMIRSFEYSYFDDEYCEDDLGSLLTKTLNSASLTSDVITTVSYNPFDNKALAVVKRMFSQDCQNLDVSKATGYAPACSTLFSISVALSKSYFENQNDNNYILAFFNVSRSLGCAAVFEKIKK